MPDLEQSGIDPDETLPYCNGFPLLGPSSLDGPGTGTKDDGKDRMVPSMANVVYCSVLFWKTNPGCIQDRLLGRHAALRANRNLFSAWPDWYGGYLWQIGVPLADYLPVS
jgi:hypothetical protein